MDRSYGETGFPQHRGKKSGLSEGRLGSLGGADGFPIAGGSGYLLGRHSVRWIHVFRLSRCLDYQIDL